MCASALRLAKTLFPLAIASENFRASGSTLVRTSGIADPGMRRMRLMPYIDIETIKLQSGSLVEKALQLIGDRTEGAAKVGPHQRKGGDRRNRDQCRDQRILDSRDT